MPNTTESLATADPVDHAADAEAFFKAGEAGDTPAVDTAAADRAAAEKAAADKAAADKAAAAKTKTTEQSAVDKVLNLGKEKPEQKTDAIVEKDPFEGIVEPDPKSKHRPEWDKVKTIAETFRTRATAAETENAALKAQLAKATPAEADAATKARLAELEQINATMSERLRAVDLKSHPDFEKQFVAPQREAKSAIEQILATEELSDVNIDRLLSLKGKELAKEASEVMGQLSEFNKAAFTDAVRKHVAAQSAADAAGKNSYEHLKTHAQRAQAANRAVFDREAAPFKDLFLPAEVDPTTPDPAAVEYNNALATVRVEAEKLAFGKTDEAGVARMAHKAAMFDFMLTKGVPRIGSIFEKHITEKNAKISDLESKLAGLRAARPGIKTGGDDGGGEKKLEEISHADAARQIDFSAE